MSGGGAITEGKIVWIEFRQIDRIVDALADGQARSALLGRLEKLEAQKAGLDAELAAPPAPRTVITEGFASHYRRKIDALIDTLNAPDLRAEAGERLRAAIGKVVLAPDAESGLSAELHGDLAEILTLGAGQQKPADGDAAAGQISMVAGAGFEPATFRL